MSQVKKSLDNVIRRSWKSLPESMKANIRPLLPMESKSIPAIPRSTQLSNKEPLVSVIIPVHNVIAYLATCLDSVLNQDYQNLEIIIVDDGSTDGSTELAKEYAVRDKRIIFLQIDHSGNGAARNTGISRASGKYLTFVDSDDILIPGSYTHMVENLTSSGSDFVVGAFRRRKGDHEWLPQMMNEIHSVDRLQIRVDDHPLILRDIFLWNKMFSRDFWDKHVGQIPEGVLYEDQETIVRAFLRAASFDVLRRPVYVWRIREDNSSITQQKGDINDLRDRMNAAITVTNLVRAEGNDIIRNAWYVKSLGEDLRPYINKVPNTGEDYWHVLQHAVSVLYSAAGSDVLSELPVGERVLAFLTAENRRSEVEDVLVAMRDHGQTFTIFDDKNVLVAAPIYAGSLSSALPSEILQIRDIDTKIHTRLLNLRWPSKDVLEIRVAAYMSAVDATRFPYSAVMTLINTTTMKTLSVETVKVVDPRVDQVSGDRWNSYTDAVFDAQICVDDLLSVDDQKVPNGQEWSLVVSVQAAGLTKTDVVRVRDGELLPFQLPIADTDSSERVVAQIDRNQGLRFRVVRYGSMAARIESRGLSLDFAFRAEKGELPEQVILRNDYEELTGVATETPEGRLFTVELPDRFQGNKDMSWDVLARSSNGRIHYVGWSASNLSSRSLPAPDGAIRVSVTGYGYLRVMARPWRVTVSECTIDTEENILILRGRSSHINLGGEQLLDLILATNRSIIKPVSVKPIPGTENFVAVFPFVSDTWGYGHCYPDAGHYRLQLRTVATDGTVRRQRVSATGRLLEDLPVEALTDNVRIALTAEDRERSFVVKFLAPYKLDERGPFLQQKLREVHLTGLGTVDKNVVLLESFGGKSATDSVKMISRVLGEKLPHLNQYWTVSDFSVPVPEGCTGVLMYSAEWYKLLNSAGILINNNNFPAYFRKRPEQFYLQTWHGTPLKKIGNHTPIDNLSASYRKLMAREAAWWDVLLSQNDFAAGVLPSAFGYTGEVINEGYPRNDSLYAEDAMAKRERVRKQLGLESGSLCILYAPTWRDNLRTSQNKFDTVNYLEFDKVLEDFGDECVILFRGHHNVAGQRNTADRSTFIDVTNYPEIADLYLAADVMVTDYSSSMFDFCGTGKPILFLAPDIEEYRSVTRGFYFDFELEAPGPIVSTTSEIVQHLKDLESLREIYEDRYRAFVKTYAPFDDGSSAVRVVEAISSLREVLN